MIFPEILIKKSVRYKVMPIGMRTTIPAIKLFLILAKIDFFNIQIVHFLGITRIYYKNNYQDKNCN